MFRRVGLLASRLAFATLIAVAPTLPVWQGGVAEAAPRFQTAATTETRLDPHLQAYLAGSPSRMTVVPVRPVNGTVRARGVAQPAGVNVLIEATRDIRADLRTLGANARTRASRSGIYTATVPLNALQAVANLAGVIKVTASMPTAPTLDKSLAAAKVTDGEEGPRPVVTSGTEAVGSETLVAIVDTGIDYTHADFKDGGTTRIVALWDQTAPSGAGTAAAGLGSRAIDAFDYGTECTVSQINSSTCSQRDTDGHGTHVASIAAGTYGVAPSAGIIVVKYDFTTASAIDAWAWVIAKASDLGKPVVINNSWASHNGAHDGTAIEERALDDYAQLSGVSFVVAAGNNGADAIHARGTVASTQSASVGFVSTGSTASMNFWYGADDNFSVKIGHNGQYTSKAIKGGKTRSYTLDGASFSVSNCSTASTSRNLCQLSVTADTLSGSGWSVELERTALARAESTGQWDAWVTGGGATFSTQSYRTTLGEPATAAGAITVGSFVSKDSWTAASGGGLTNGETVGAHSAFSSLGPTRDGRAKPDLVAPGEVIEAALSKDEASPSVQRITSGGAGVADSRIVLQGTSMAAPHVAGIVAMMYQKNAGYTQSQIRDALLGTNASANTDVDSYTANTGVSGEDVVTLAANASGNSGRPAWNNRWGYGKVDGKKAVDAVTYDPTGATATPTASSVPQPTSTATSPASATSTAGASATSTASATATSTASSTPTASGSASATRTSTSTITPNVSFSATPSPSATNTSTATVTPNPAFSATASPTSTAGGTSTATITPNVAFSATPSPSSTASSTSTVTPNPAFSATASPSSTASSTSTATITPNVAFSAT
ncbi:MAG: hypothetical protein RL022_1772, partial [Chloroflexota bacterium]